MKKIVVACGAGIATSTVAIQKLKAGFEKRGLLSQIQFTQCTVAELPTKSKGHDLIVTTAQFSQDLEIPVVSGLPFITGIGADKLVDDIVAKLGI
ncbi:PTS sugar transporter subunit IIB [Peptostreptococcus russellii]|uniref:PTS sugar transporter subunit IIB n=1 Tax=Peptostreptococcus russellii TaxID=215200 RepID=UPI002943C6BD|nr:PTS sugar transporter subunit IIB [Peptostreptococcus russellii]